MRINPILPEQCNVFQAEFQAAEFLLISQISGLITGMVAAPGTAGMFLPGLPGGPMLQMMPPRFR
uniref:Uncharacterized protein n=1 Tax=Megaselia scalaris TaxID=36166 RepID=T1GRF4_MEGSC